VRILILLSICCLTACTTVQPWEKDLLAKPEMQFGSIYANSRIKYHTYKSKEAARGNAELASGGCGCN